MTDENLKKLEAAMAAAQAKVPVPSKKLQQQPPPTPPPPPPISKLKKVFVRWHEGNDELVNSEFTTWHSFQKALEYYFTSDDVIKMGVLIKWENGKEFSERLDINAKNFHDIAQYIKKLEEAQGRADGLSFEDDAPPAPTVQQRILAAVAPTSYPVQQQAKSAEVVVAPPPAVDLDIYEFVNYSKYAFAVFSEDEKPYKEFELRPFGSWNYRLKYRFRTKPGWIFANRHRAAVEQVLLTADEQQPEQPPVNEAILFLQWTIVHEWQAATDEMDTWFRPDVDEFITSEELFEQFKNRDNA